MTFEMQCGDAFKKRREQATRMRDILVSYTLHIFSRRGWEILPSLGDHKRVGSLQLRIS